MCQGIWRRRSLRAVADSFTSARALATRQEGAAAVGAWSLQAKAWQMGSQPADPQAGVPAWSVCKEEREAGVGAKQQAPA